MQCNPLFSVANFNGGEHSHGASSHAMIPELAQSVCITSIFLRLHAGSSGLLGKLVHFWLSNTL